ncbi:clathrin heavy chain linker domain-containing protein 1 [Strongylocentrotus purpuratus]|uniref:Translin-associated factor X-interacting protein 1 N-terminal domain-containing protein n=1 Tax=Strongylocentrotus purpuratus TaxID=7668 RepID=A0A7M7RCK3_STRPU|nr:clathrin heavy chain linker domain-containing protein 1 [Strongylocentrotus purpuratus]|eukprot:XP_784207.2 PREDICTED: clathrin heavy chain linker domain-containing protein 1 [Strongylocentrotus purpuratus]
MSRMPQPQPNQGSRRVLPPISPSPDVYQQFLRELEEQINVELASVECAEEGHADPHRYAIYKGAFDQIIDNVSAYKPLLSAIKAEYEDCIDTIEKGQEEAFYLSGKVKALASEQTTLSLYQKRADELEQKLVLVRADNEKFKAELEKIAEIYQEREEVKRKAEEEIEEQKKKMPTMPDTMLKGMDLDECTDVERLESEISRLKVVLATLKQTKITKYSTKERKNELKTQLENKTKARDHVQEQNQQLKERCLKVRIALDALASYYKEKRFIFGPAEAVSFGLTRSGSMMSVRSQETVSTFEDDDPTKEREAELLLEYIEQFNEMFEEGRYGEAAMHAANSPKGILRNPETLHRFKSVRVKRGQKSPLLIYAESLMSSVPAIGFPPNADATLECVKSALSGDRLDIVTHWIANNWLTYSEPLGHLLYNYAQGRGQQVRGQDVVSQCLPLAQAVYTKVRAHLQAAVCMSKQGRVHAMLEYAQSVNFSRDAYLGVLVACPSLALAEVLVQPSGHSTRPVLSVGSVVSTLLKTQDHHQIGVELIDNIHHSISSGSSKLRLKDLVFHDPDTKISSWQKIIRACNDSGSYDVGLELLAAVTVLEAIKKAADSV